MKIFCPGFIWDRIDFLCSLWHDAMYWLWEKNNTDNTPMYSCCWTMLYGAKDISLPQLLMLSCQWERLQGHKDLREDRTRTAHPTRPKGYSIPYGIIWKTHKTEGSWPGGLLLLRNWLGISKWWAIVLCIICFVNVYIYLKLSLLLFHSSSS